MTTWPGGIRRAFLLALAWGVAWAPLGVLTGLILDPDGAMDEPWIAIGAYPGFLSALVFSIVLAFTDARRGLDQLSPARVAGWGAVSGLLVIVLPFAGFMGSPNTDHALWRGRFLIVAAVTLLSAASAVASVLIARMAKERQLRHGSGRVG